MFEFNIFRIPVRVHPWFWISMLMLGYIINQGHTGQLLMIKVALFTIIAFLSILAHELGHALTGKKLSGGWPEINLVGFGGNARFNGGSFTKWKHIFMVAAGPAVNFFLSALFFLIFFFVMLKADPSVTNLLTEFCFIGGWLNLIWGIFNLIPVFPLDGGQIMHSFIRDQYKAHQISLVISIIMIAISLKFGFIFSIMIFAFMGYQNFEMMQMIRPRR